MHFWSKKPTKNLSKTTSKPYQHRCYKCVVFQHRFLSVLGSFWKAKMPPKSINIYENCVSEPFCFGIVFLYRCLIDLCSKLRPTGSQKPLFLKIQGFLKNRLSMLTSSFDPILVLTWLHFWHKKSMKIFLKIDPKRHQKMIDFGIDFLAILAPFWEPSWGHVGIIFG